MIHRVEIDNFALVEHTGVSFGAGLTVLSGETGAGKSIVVDALEFACFPDKIRSKMASLSLRADCETITEVTPRLTVISLL
jgi:DNA repair protein RecN (Recombination protein N)